MPTQDRFYHTEKTAEEYIKMAAGYDGRELIDILQEYLPANSTVLELGMGPGIDLDILSGSYSATGSDLSQVFLDKYRAKNPGADLLLLDAITLKTDRTFDAIYSNKVLHHLTNEELTKSIGKQEMLITSGGIVCHSFWCGKKEEHFHGMLFNYHSKKEIEAYFSSSFNIKELRVYEEMSKDDSILLIASRK